MAGVQVPSLILVQHCIVSQQLFPRLHIIILLKLTSLQARTMVTATNPYSDVLTFMLRVWQRNWLVTQRSCPF